MPTETEYILFAANAYSASRAVVNEKNDIPIPSGWELIKLTSNSGVNNATGFLARAYRQGNEVVVSYAGTTFEDGLKGLELDFRNGNLPAASGLTLAAQVVDAARFYLDVRKTYPGADVSFTGHSLGGGLASL
ncbi:MAG: lipase family protein, partial [Betaproteobacteria bacterium]